MIPTSELADLRAASLDVLPDTCIILSPSTASDGQGGQTTTWGTASTSACRLDKMDGSEGYIGASRQAFSGYMLTLPSTTVLLNNYRVTHGGYTYSVITVNEDQTNLILKRAELERV